MREMTSELVEVWFDFDADVCVPRPVELHVKWKCDKVTALKAIAALDGESLGRIIGEKSDGEEQV